MIYFIDDGMAIKVGFTHDIPKRLKQLQTGNPRELTLIHSMDGNSKKEWRIHNQLRPFRIRGEWFNREAVLNFIETIERKKELTKQTRGNKKQVSQRTYFY